MPIYVYCDELFLYCCLCRCKYPLFYNRLEHFSKQSLKQKLCLAEFC